jgi:ethanolamine utilization protein EutN
MQLCRVTGNLVSTQKNPHLVGHKLLLVRQIDLEGKLIGDDDMISLDLIDAGIGDIVLVAKEGDAVQQILGHKNAPVNTIIIAIVDDIEVAA